MHCMRKVAATRGNGRPNGYVNQGPILGNVGSTRVTLNGAMSRVDNLNRILRRLLTGSPDVEASALISEDGLMIASALPAQVDDARVAGITATLASLGMRATSELERGTMGELLVGGDRGYAVMLATGSGTLLLALTSKQAKLGLLFLDMRRAADEIRKVL